MDRIRIESSNIWSYAFDHETHVLEVQFKRAGGPGPVYQYSNVPETEWFALQRAGSKGAYFAQHIRNRYPAIKL